MSLQWDHVADLASLQRDRNSEIRLRLVQSQKGYGVEIRKYDRSHHHDGMNAAGPGLIVRDDRVPELILGLQKAMAAASAMRDAERA